MTRDPNFDTNAFVVFAIMALGVIGLGFVLFPRHEAHVGPAAPAAPQVGGTKTTGPVTTPAAETPTK